VVKLKWSTLQLPKQTVPQKQLFASSITGTKETFNGKMAVIFPVPADNEIAVEWNLPRLSDCDYLIIDLMGRKLKEGNFVAGEKESIVDIRTLSSGFFILRTSEVALPFIKK
jgi:hypothetical protein